MAKILISIDHKWRDLPGYVYAGLLLKRLGHRVEYVRNNLEKHYISTVKPDLVLLNHLYPVKKQELAKYLQRHNIRVAILPTEGIPTLQGLRSFAAGKGCDLSGVDLHFVWNRPMAEILRENLTLADHKIAVVGVPRFDFYRKPLSSILLTKPAFLRKYALNPNYPLITFATNFTQASFHTTNQDFFLKNANRLGYDKVFEELFGDCRDIPKRDFRSREILTDAFVMLVKNYPEVNFVLKLHPSEDHQFYQNLIKKNLSACTRRVRIITHEYIWDVLNATDIELKRSCTTGIEAWILDKPTIEMQLNSDEWYFSPEHSAGSDIVRSPDELVEKISGYLSGTAIDKNLQQARQHFIRKWCHTEDGNATRTMVKHLHNLLDNHNDDSKIPSSLKKKIIYHLLTFGDHMGHDARVYGLINTLSKNYVDKLGRFDKYFHQRDIIEWKQRLSGLHGSN